MHQFKDKFIDQIQNHPKRYLLVSLFMFMALAPGLLFLKTDFSYRIWYSEQDPLLQRYDNFEKKFGNDDNLIIGVYHKDGLYNKNSLQLIAKITEEVWKLDSMVRVDSLANFDYIATDEVTDDIDIIPLLDLENDINDAYIQQLKQRVKSHPHIQNTFISEDGKLAIIIGKIKPSFESIADNQLITTQARNLIKKLEKNNDFPGYEYQLSGTVVLTHLFKEITEQDLLFLLPLLYLIFTIILWIVFRRKSGIIIPYSIITISILMMMGTVSYLGQKINTLSSVAPNILLTVALADTIHILTAYFFGLKQGFSNSKAVKYTLQKNFYPTLLTSLTTSIGFFSFSSAKIEPISGMGISVGFGVIYAWLCTYLIVGPILQLLPKIKKLKNEQAGDDSIESVESNIKITPTVSNYVQLIYKFRRSIVSVSFILALAATYLANTRLVVNLDPYAQFPDDYQFNVDLNKIKHHLGPMDNIEFMIDAGGTDLAKDPAFLNKVDQYQNWLNQQPYIAKTFSIIDILKDINKTLNNGKQEFYKLPQTSTAIGQGLLFYTLGLPPGRDINNRITMNFDAVHLSATWNIFTSKEANEKIKLMQAKADELGLKSTITGKMPLFHDLTPYVVTSFTDSFTLAFILITIILIIVLKSVKLGFLALIPNIFPLIMGAGIYALSGEFIDMPSVLIASVSLGIAVDDSIHFLFEYKKYRNMDYDIFKTIELIFTNTAPSLINTTIIIALGFGSFYLATYIPNAKFGVMVAIILLIAIIADLILLPAVLFMADSNKKKAK